MRLADRGKGAERRALRVIARAARADRLRADEDHLVRDVKRLAGHVGVHLRGAAGVVRDGAEHRDLSHGAGVAEEVHRRRDRPERGLELVPDEGDARGLDRLVPSGERLDRRERGGRDRERHAQADPGGNGGETGVDPMQPAQPGLHGHALLAMDESEREPVGPGAAHRLGADKSVGMEPVGEDTSPAAARHREHPGIVGVEHRESRARDRVDHLGLLGGGRIQRPEGAPVVAAHVGDDGDTGANQGDGLVEAARAGGAQLVHAEAVPPTRAEDGVGHPVRRVVSAGALAPAVTAGEHRGDQILGRRLPGAAGDRDEAHAGHGAPVPLRHVPLEATIGGRDQRAAHAASSRACAAP